MCVVSIAYPKDVLPLYPHPRSPRHYFFPPLAACGLWIFYLHLTYREIEA